jgi:hypothetical protein
MSDVGDASQAASGGLGEAVDAAAVSPGELRDALIWVQEGRSPTVGEAREYFDAHAAGGGDPNIMEECEQVLDATDPPTRSLPGSGSRGTTPSPFPQPSEDQLDEEGSD